MASPLRASAAASASATPQWQQPSQSNGGVGEVRSVTPAMNNTRGSARNPYPSRVPSPTPASSYGARMSSPQRYYGQNGFDQVNNNNSTGVAGGATSAANTNGVAANNAAHNINANNNTAAAAAQQQQQQQPQQPSSTGLIRLTLRKPMGIVFEPMYDPNQPSVQRGVRICDLPRTGAAALSRRLEIGDELLSINDKTMSRLTFDEIMDFIIEADPEQVNLLFRRPRKEVLAARNAAIHYSTTAAAAASHSAKPTPASVKWVDDDAKKHNNNNNNNSNEASSSSKKKNGKKDSTSSSSKKKKSSRTVKSDDDTFETYDDESRTNNNKRKKGRSKRDPYENESFLDLLIDTICANPDNVCKSRGNRDHDYYSDEEEDDRTLASYDDSTYVTYESEKPEPTKKKSSKDKDKESSNNNNSKRNQVFDSETEEDTIEDDRRRSSNNKKDNKKDEAAAAAAASKRAPQQTGKYEDDHTLETIETRDRPIPPPILPTPSPLGLAPVQELEPPVLQVPVVVKQQQKQQQQPVPTPTIVAKQQKQQPTPISTNVAAAAAQEEKNKAPISELEYDDFIDADVSVMESLGGPSLLIEKQRQALALTKSDSAVPADIINEFGSDYPAAYGLTREQTIHRDPIKFYSFVVKALLEQHEPEKVRLLDKLLAKYKGREDHLVQKLSVRYKRVGQEEEEAEEDEDMGKKNGALGDFTSAVNTKKESPATEVAVQKAQERAAAATFGKWPDKETKEPEPIDTAGNNDDDDDESDEDDSEFSGDSIDGTSPAVIAQVSELLNYVYGKTSVPGQIDRVSTIMRAYEGREAVLLELLETKALIKANSEKENAANLPSFLRNSPALQQTANANMQQQPASNIINDDISSMSGVSSPAPENGRSDEQPPSLTKTKVKEQQQQQQLMKESKKSNSSPAPMIPTTTTTTTVKPTAVEAPQSNGKKKKGFLGGLFGKKNRKSGTAGRIRKGKTDGEGSI